MDTTMEIIIQLQQIPMDLRIMIRIIIIIRTTMQIIIMIIIVSNFNLNQEIF